MQAAIRFCCLAGLITLLAGCSKDNGSDPGLTLCDLTDHTLTGLRECNNGRSGAIAFGIRDNDGLAAFHHGDTGIRRAKINTNNFSHNSNPPKEVT